MPWGTTVAFSEYALAVEGIPQTLDGIGIVLVVPPVKLGPPKSPGGFRVSATRHGVTGIKRSARLAAVTTCVMSGESLPMKFASPPYLADIECAPNESEDVVKVACADAFNPPVPIGAPASLNVTIPVGTAALLFTVAVKVTG